MSYDQMTNITLPNTKQVETTLFSENSTSFS